MSVENSESAEGDQIEVKPVNGTQDQRLNGLSNGHIESSSSSKHKSSSKDKYRDKDKDYKSSKSSSSNRDKESSDKHKSSSSSSKDKYRDKDRDKDRQRDKDKDKERDKEKYKSSSSSHKSSRDKDRDREKDKEKERSKDKDREKDKEREKDRERDREKDREKDKDKDRNREKDKERSKEKSDRDHEKRDRENDKDRKKEHKSSSDKDRKDRERDKEREKEKSESSSKDKDRDRYKSSKDKHSSSSSKSRDKEKDREKHSSCRDKDRSKDKEKQSKEVSPGKDQSDEDKKEIKDIKKEVDIPRNDYDQSCSGFSVKGERDIKPEINKYGYETKAEIKEDFSNFNISQASSCDYSMSQFREDEPCFDIKAEMTDEENVENEPLEESAQDEEMQEAPREEEEDDDDDVPLAKRKAPPVVEEDSDDDVPLVSRKKQKSEKTEKKEKKLKRKKKEAEDDFMDEKPKKKKTKKEKAEPKDISATESPTKGRKKKAEEETQDVWRWWEEEKREDGVKWTFLEHKGPIFAPEYEPLPNNVKFYYNGKEMRLSQNAEEVACFYAKMLNHDYVTKKAFNDNFFKDWRKSMTSKEKDIIKDLSKCNFKEMHDYFTAISEKNKSRSKEEKLALKEANEKLIQEYGFCTIDGHKEKIGNFKLEPPGLFRGRGEHPKMGLVKRRIMPEDVSINCSKDSKIPEPPKGHKWKEVRHDNTVTWLASWVENVQGQVKYIMLNPSSKLKGEKDFQKYETARRLDKHIEQIRATYRDEWKSKEMRIRQRGVALYFIDRLALRAGNEKDEDQADTVGCCSLRVEHVQLHKEMNGKENVVVFDFLGKDSIRYYNEVEVEKRVFKNLELFMENKKEGDDLFDRLNTAVLNEHLRELMEGLTAKVFRTYNASITLQNQLDLLTDPDASIPEKLLAYNRANRAVAVLCNHQRSIPKSHAKSMENLKEKIRQKKDLIDETASELKDLQKQAKRGSVKERLNADKKAKQLEKLKEQLKKLELQETDRDENKTIALGTSKLNYLDPRISVAWCKKHKVPIEKIFNKTQRDKFRWAIHMADEDYRF